MLLDDVPDAKPSKTGRGGAGLVDVTGDLARLYSFTHAERAEQADAADAMRARLLSMPMGGYVRVAPHRLASILGQYAIALREPGAKVSAWAEPEDDEREPVRPDARLVVTREAGGYLARIEGDEIDPGAIADTPEEAVQMMVRGPASRFARVVVVTDYDDDDEPDDDDDDGGELELVEVDDDDQADDDDDDEGGEPERFGYVDEGSRQLAMFDDPPDTRQRRLRWMGR
jgi:hypothetical protein